MHSFELSTKDFASWQDYVYIANGLIESSSLQVIFQSNAIPLLKQRWENFTQRLFST